MVTLDGNNLVVVLRPQVHAVGSPGIEVSSNIDGSAGAVVLADGPVLMEGRELVVADCLKDVVCASINGDGALEDRRGRGVVRPQALHDVVLDKGVSGPAVDGEVAVADGAKGSRVGDCPGLSARSDCNVGIADLLCTSWVPPLSCEEVALAAPGHSILTASFVGVQFLALFITPVLVVVSVVHTSLIRTLLKAGVGAGWLFSEDASNGGCSNEEGGKVDHFVRLVRAKIPGSLHALFISCLS